MKKVLTMVVLVLTMAFAGPVFATNYNNSNTQDQSQNQGQAQGQAQGQLQGQAQAAIAAQGQSQGQVSISEGSSASSGSSSGSSASSGSSSVSSSDNNLEITYEDTRQFAPTLQPFNADPGSVRWAPEKVDKVRGYIDLKTFVFIKSTIDLKDRVQNNNIEREVTLFVPEYTDSFPESIRVESWSPREALAIGTMWSKDDEDSNTTAALVTEAGRFCSKYGAFSVYVIKQSVTSDAVSSGWGIGLSGNMAGINSDGDISSVGAAGTGYSKARGGHRYRLGLEFACMK